MSAYDIWLFVHVSAVVVWLGGGFAAQVLTVLAKRSGDPARVGALGRDLGFMATKVFLPASLVVFATGVLLTEDGGWSWSEPFVWLGVLGWAGVSLAAFGYVTREIGAVGARMAAEGPSPALAARVGRLVLLARIFLLVLFAIVFLMTVKPGT
ncbi:MAG TPA: DUF2269 family protein [Gaiellaceae bacterium]|nr:DUF2269 family protein [Gaiellaceae bacterium]